jgi:hypothetical protein
MRPRIYFDGSHRPKLDSTRWAVHAQVGTRSITRHGSLPGGRNSYDAELYALEQAQRLARHLARVVGPVLILGDHEGLLSLQVSTLDIAYRYVFRDENPAHYYAGLHPLPLEHIQLQSA